MKSVSPISLIGRLVRTISLRTAVLIAIVFVMALLGVAARFGLPLVTAQSSNVALQSEGVPAPAKIIRPASVSVINFKELASQDAGANAKGAALPAESLAIHPPMTIKEVDTPPLPQPLPSGPGDIGGPLASSPAPSQSFLAQEDAPKAGTGTSTIPPDTMGAVGPDKIFVNVNNNYRVQNKTTGAALSTVSINTFWASTGATGVFDPRVQYDPYNNRWIVAAVSSSQCQFLSPRRSLRKLEPGRHVYSFQVHRGLRRRHAGL